MNNSFFKLENKYLNYIQIINKLAQVEIQSKLELENNKKILKKKKSLLKMNILKN